MIFSIKNILDRLFLCYQVEPTSPLSNVVMILLERYFVKLSTLANLPPQQRGDAALQLFSSRNIWEIKNFRANLPPEQGGDAAVLLAAAPQLHPLHLIRLWRQNKQRK